MEDELNLDELQNLAKELHIDLSWFELPEGRNAGTLFISSLPEYGSIARADYVDAEHGASLVKLLRALPRLIELCKEQRECIKTLSPYALHERCAEQD